MSIEQIIISLSYLGILLLMTSNGFCGFPSSQFIYLAAGYFAFEKELSLSLIILIGALGHSIGNLILYEIARKKGLKYSVKFIKFFFQLQDPELQIKKFQIAFEKKSKFLLFIGKLANPSKIFIPIPAGIIKMNRITYLIITYITSAIWGSIFTFIGFYFGKSYENFGFIGAGLIFVFILVMAYFYKIMNSKEILDEIKNEKQEEKKQNKQNTKDQEQNQNQEQEQKPNKQENNKKEKIKKQTKTNKNKTRKTKIKTKSKKSN